MQLAIRVQTVRLIFYFFDAILIKETSKTQEESL